MSELRTIETFVVDSVKQTPVPGEIPGCPLGVEARRMLLRQCPIVVSDIGAEETEPSLPFTLWPTAGLNDTNQYSLWQPGPMHVRSFALNGPDMDTVWADEQGNLFGSLNLKGVNFSKPGVMEHPTASNGFVAWGLQESNIIGRVLRASEVLTSRSVGTERIIGLAEPQYYPWPLYKDVPDMHEFIGLQEYKSRIVDGYWRTMPESERTLEALADLTTKFKDMTFFVSLRAVDNPFRLNELANPEVRQKVFDLVNKYHLNPDEKPYDIGESGAPECYFVDFLAPRVGKNLARMHPDLAHGFANGLNVTALGGIVDLDSVHGTGLDMGDEPVTNIDRAKDILDIIRDICRLSDPSIIYSEEFNDHAAIAFIDAYFDEVLVLKGDNPETVEYLCNIMAFSHSALEKSGSTDILADYTLKLFANQYFHKFFRERFPDQIAEFAPHIDSFIAAALDNNTVALGIVDLLDSNIPSYAHILVTDSLSDIPKPEEDLVSAFMKDTSPNNEVRELIAADIASQLVVYCSQSIGTSPHLPQCIKDIKDPVLRTVLQGTLLGEFYEIIADKAREVAQTEISFMEDRLRSRVKFESPQSLLPDQEPIVFTGIERQRYWLLSEKVSLDAAAELLRDRSYAVKFGTLPEQKSSAYCFSFGSQYGMQELITDGIMDAVYAGDPWVRSQTDLEIDAENCTFVIFVSHGQDGTLGLEVLVDTEETAEHLRGMPRQATAKKPALLAPTLF